jgi:hypothetical protein
MSRKQIPRTMAKETNRWRRKEKRACFPKPGAGTTPQMVLSASWSWAKTPVAPKIRTATPR